MKKLIAIIYTALLTFEAFVGPLFFKWYEIKLGCVGDEPCGEILWPIIYTTFLVLGQMALCGYLWVRVFDDKIK